MDKHHIVSSGGCGTWFLSGAITNAGIHHARGHFRDPGVFSSGKVVYLYCNPLNAVLSFKRRNEESPGNLWFCNHMRNLGLTPSPDIDFAWILKNKRDPFQLKEHFDIWFNYDDRKYDIMFLKYESIPKHEEEIRDWFKAPQLALPFHKRQSSWGHLDDDLLAALAEIYTEQYERWCQMGDIVILGKKS